MTITLNGDPLTQTLDRGLQFGDGHFTTLRVAHGQPLHWPLHWQRLQNANKTLYLPTIAEETITDWLQELIADSSDCVVKIIITRGIGGRGYIPAQNITPNVYLVKSELPPATSQLDNLAVADLRLARQPQLAGLKTLNRLEQVLLAVEREQRRTDDLLVLDQHNQIIECCQGNLFWYHNGGWHTPMLQNCGIQGVARQAIIAGQWLPKLTIGDYTLDDLYQAEQAFVCNSVRGAVPIAQLNGKVLSIQIPAVLKQLIS